MISKLTDGPRVNADLSRTGAISSRGENRKKSLNAAPWSQTWPAPQATLDLDFANDRGYVRGVGQGRSMDAVTFTRASVGRFVDQDGLLQEAANNTPRFDWASTAQRPQNLLLYTEEFDNAAWVKTAGVLISANTSDTTAPDGSNTAEKYTTNTTARNYIARVTGLTEKLRTVSIYAKNAGRNVISIGATITGRTSDGNYPAVDVNLTDFTYSNSPTDIVVNSVTDVGDGWCRISVTLAQSASNVFVSTGETVRTGSFYGAITSSADTTNGVYIWGAQYEEGDTATPYIANGAYSATNIPLAANPTCNGLLIEETRTNRLLWNRDATQTQWVKTDVTAAKDQTGIDGVTNAASSLTATANNGTCIQTITLGAASRTGSVFLKRITGTGNVQVSLDGSTWSTVDLSDTEWRRIVLSGTVTNPTVGIRLATNGDAVAMDYGQVEDNSFLFGGATSPILTTTASVTRSADNADILGSNFAGFYDNRVGTLFVESNTLASNSGNTVVSVSLFSSATNSLNMGSYQASQGLIFGATGGDIYADGQQPRAIPFFGKHGLSYKNTFLLNSLNGSIEKSVSNIVGWGGRTPPTQMSIGRGKAIFSFSFPGTLGIQNIKRIIYIPAFSSSAALANLTQP
jgi:hypothetical protein